MILNKKTKLAQKIMALSLLFAFTQSSIGLAANDTILRSRINSDAIIDMESYDRLNDTSTLRLNELSKITDSKTKISISLRDSDVQQVLRMLADKAGLSIVFHSSVGGGSGSGYGRGGAGSSQKITLDLVNTSVNDAFLLVLDTCGLSYYLDGNKLTVASKDAIAALDTGKQNLTTLPVKYVDAADVSKFLNKNIFSSKITGLSSGEPVTVNPRTNEIVIFGSKNDVEVAKKVLSKLDIKPMINTFKVNHTTPKEMAMLICDSVLNVKSSSSGASSSSSGDDLSLGGGVVACKTSDSSGGSSGGGFSGGPGAFGGSSVSREPFGKNALSVSYFPQLGTVSVFGGSIEQVDVIKQFIVNNDRKQLMAYLEMSIVELNERGSKEFNNYWNFNTPLIDFGFDANGRTSSGSTNLYYEGKAFQDKFPWDDKGIEVGRWIEPYLKDGEWQDGKWLKDYVFLGNYTGLRYSVDLAISNGNGRSLSNPKIMVTNGQKSTIDLSGDYVKSVKTEFATSSASLTPIATRTYEIGEDLGLKIEVTPFISLDGYVSLNVKPEYSTKSGEVLAPTTDPETGARMMDLVATLLQRRNLDLKNLRVKDGETLVIAGMVTENEAQTVKKVPFFGDLPLVGVLFRQTSNNKEKSELVIMITPHIIYDDEQLANVKRKENL